MEAPIPFILAGGDGISLEVAEQAKSALGKIKKPVVVVSVVGMYRTGKSFLLNRLMNRTDGFPLGSTVEAKTKGIWMWVGDFPGDSTKALVLLDTEGLNGPEKGDKSHDVQIFTLAVLLSSILVYNSKGTIDASALDGLHLATELTSHITMKTDGEEETGEDFAKFFPTLIWAVRDQHLELSVDGQEITADQYLEKCLALKKGRTAATIAYNGLRETIRAFFHNRHCFLFPLPTSLDNLKNLDSMSLTDLDAGFTKVGDTFAEFVGNNAPSKMVKGKAITGGMFATLAELYTEAIVKGNIESAYEAMIRLENTKSLKAAVDFYQAEMSNIQLPVEIDSLNAANAKAQTAATVIFLKTAVNTQKNQGYFDEMSEELKTLFEGITEKNSAASKQKCLSFFASLYKPVDEKVVTGEFTRPGGHQAYKSQVDKVELDYSRLPDGEMGPCRQDALLIFRRDKVRAC